MNSKKTTAVKEALERGERLTSLSAFNLCHTTRLSAIIFNLRKQGMNIVTVEKENSNGERYGEYHLEND